MLQRMRELAVQASTGTLSATDHDALDTEFHALRQEINRIALNTEWNGSHFSSAGLGHARFQVGANASQTMFYNFQTLSSSTGNRRWKQTTDQNLFGGT